MKPKIFTFDVYQASELSAGLRGYTDVVVVTVESEDVGGLEVEFQEHILDSLREWYDAAKVAARE